MAEETSVAVPEVGNEEAQNASVTETPQTSQETAEPQTTSTPQVESGVKEPQVQEPSRPQYDGLFRSERKRIRRLEAELAELRKDRASQNTKQDVPSVTIDPNLMLQDPQKYHEALVNLAREEARKEADSVRQMFREREEQQKAQSEERAGLEALEKLFPKTSPDSKETLEERVQKNPELAEKLKEFFELPHVKAMAAIDPNEAAEYAVVKLGIKPPTPNPLVLKKGAMGGVGTGNPSMGSKRSVSEEDLKSELKKLNDQAEANPNLRFDDNFKKRKSEVITSLTKLVTKK